jgi:hypothetical protein
VYRVPAVVVEKEQLQRQKLSEVLRVELWWVERCPLGEGAADPGQFANPAGPPHGSFQSASSSSATSRTTSFSLHPDTRISPTIGSMSQPVVQTIHRDPALLYVSAWLEAA